MRFKNIHLGAWYPGSTVQLKEFYSALGFKRSPLFGKKELTTWMKGMQPQTIEYVPDAINSVQASFRGGTTCDVSEDGLMIVSSGCADLKKDHKRLNAFLNTRFLPFWRNLFVSRMSRIDIFDDQKVFHPVVLVAEGGTAEDMEAVYKQFDFLVYKKLPLERGEIWIGDSLVIAHDLELSDHDTQEAVRYLMFARLYEMHVRGLFSMQKELWNKIESIRHQRLDRSRDLPEVRDEALMIQDQAALLKSRSRQMQQFLDWRENYIRAHLPDHILSKVFQNFFLSLESTQKYLHELWEMTANYADETVRSISLLYSQVQQRELGTLQKLFLVSAVASVVSLGTLAGSNMLTYHPDGTLETYAIIRSWDLGAFAAYGLAVFVVSVVIYYLFYLVFSRFQKAVKLTAKEQK